MTRPATGNLDRDRDSKYDRQMRLWASDGQTRLESAHVCLVNANAAGAETLKNLVLAGVGAFTVVDAGTVTQEDLSGNFFLEDHHVGGNRANGVMQTLQELNPDAQGTFVDLLIDTLVETDKWWLQFSTVVVSGWLAPGVLEKLKDILWPRNIPLLVVGTVGFYGFVHVVTKETAVVETHDPLKTFDLRIDCPWPELQAYSASFDMDLLDDTDHAHVPYIVIFIKALDRWKLDHGGAVPRTYTEKQAFRVNYIEHMARNMAVETNFIEASKSVHRALQVTLVPGSIQKLLDRVDLLLGSHTSDFWLHVRALKLFIELNGGKLPLPGNIPDMASTTSSYVKLQTIYRNKAEADRKLFLSELAKAYQLAGRSSTDISEGYAANFCKNAAFLYVANGSKDAISDSLIRQLTAQRNDTAAASDAPLHSDLAIYFGLLAFQESCSRGKTGGFEAFVSCFEEVTTISKNNFTPAIQNTLKEIFTHDSTSYHNICSVIGGVAGQEVLKIATAQYIPLDNVFVFDGIRSSSAKWSVQDPDCVSSL